uniref:Protein MMS22-like n=1 Tax=Callorhinchus milii TaxID=7868 RepID=A0A4W3JY91_CALMI
MDDDFGGSLTPPISPYVIERMETEVEGCKPPCFSCILDHRDEDRAFSVDGYLVSGSLNRLLLMLDPSPTVYEADTVNIFDFQWVTETALVESPQLLFGLLRYEFLSMERCSLSCQAKRIHCEADEIRQQCVNFLQYIKVFLFRYLEPSRELSEESVHPYDEVEAKLPSVLVEELHALTLYIGHLGELPSNILGTLTTQNQGKIFPPSWHLLHLHLDIHWSILEILHILGEKMLGQVVYAHQFMNLTGENLTSTSLFEDHCNNLLRDLIGLAVNRYIEVRPSEVLTTCHYQCGCVKELWALVIQLLNHRKKASHTGAFWSWLNNHLRNMLQGVGSMEGVHLWDITHCKDPLGFNWWLVTHLAMLHLFDRSGTTDEKKPMENNWKFVEELLKLSCPSQNGAFNIPWLGLKGLASVSKSPFSMLEMTKICCCGDQSPNLYQSENSFQFFLRILALQMKKGKETSGTHPWKQLKGRIYSKFHQRKMQELSEMGLQNFISLFLVLSAVAEMEDVVSRVSDLLDLLNPSLLSVTQRSLMWRGCFAFLLLYEEKNIDVSFLATKLSDAFQKVAKEFYLKTTDFTRKVTLWTLLSTYMDAVQEVFETSSYLHLSEEKLLNEGFSLLYPACRESELNTSLMFLQTVLARLRSVHKRLVQSPQQPRVASQTAPAPLVAKERHLAIASALWKNFFPFLKSQRLSQMPPTQVADAAAGFTLLAMDMPSAAPPELQPQPLEAILRLFGWDDMVFPQLVSRYLIHLIQNRISMDQLAELTRIVCKLPEIENLFFQAQLTQSASDHICKLDLLGVFPQAVGKTYTQLQTLGDKSAMVSKALEYVGDILKYTKPYLANKGPAEGLQLMYWTVGCLVKHWAPMLSTSKAQQLLFRIIDCLLLPHALFHQDKELPPAMLSAIRDNLPLYLQGLSTIVGQTQIQGAYVKQQLRRIVQHYFGRFLPSSPGSGIMNHPILLAFSESVSAVQAQNLRKTVLLVISENYIQFRGHAPPPRLAAVLAFLLELLERKPSADVAFETKLLLPTTLKCLILVNEPQVKKIVSAVLQRMIENCQLVSPDQPCIHLTSVLRQFIQEYIGIYDHQVYNVMEKVTALDRDLVIGLIPTLTQALTEAEFKQGLGRRHSQRESYRRLLSLLGEPGQAEIVKLEKESD